MTKRALRKIGVYALAILLALIALMPIVYVVCSSLKPGAELFRYPPTLLPEQFTLENYRDVFERADFLLYFKNTTIVAVLSTVLTVIINTMAGYAFAKYRFKGGNAIFMFFICTMMLPLEVLMIPIFQMVKRLGMYNNYLGMIIPPAATPMGVFLVRQYFYSVPNELNEAARIDGASETRTFLHLMLPIARPVMSVLAIFSFMWRWNDYLWPLIVITKNRMQTLQQALAGFVGQLQINWAALLAMTAISMLPVILVFLAFQKYFMTGISAGSVKG